jgi:phytoene synthase
MAPRPEGNSRFFACLYSPEAPRAQLEALLSVEGEITSSLLPGLDHQVAHARLQWWKDECERCTQGRPVHPLTCTLVEAFDVGATDVDESAVRISPLAGLSGSVATTVWDLAKATFETRHELTAYCERWSGAVIEPVVLYNAASVAGAWRDVGSAMREVVMLASAAGEARAGRIRIPLDELQQIGADADTLASPPWPAPLATWVHERHETLRATITRSLKGAATADHPALRGLLVWAGLTMRMSRRAQQALPGNWRPQRLDPFTDAWFAWRSARRAMTGVIST